MSTDQPCSTLAEARELVAASVASTAAALDVQLLLIKGPTLAAHGLREPRESADVDILVSPRGSTRLLAALRERGWHPYTTDTTAHVIPQHSVTMVHQRWPLELDFHHSFPGFLADTRTTFDALWARRQAFDQAHQPIFIPDRYSSILIAALHYERAPEIYRRSLDDLRARVSQVIDAEGIRELAELAAQTGCADVLEEFLGSVGAPPLGMGGSEPNALAAWRLNAAGGRVPGLAWLVDLRRARWRDRPRILWHAVMFTEDELRFRFPEAPAGYRGLSAARWWRLRLAIKALPQALRVMRDRRRG